MVASTPPKRNARSKSLASTEAVLGDLAIA